MSSPRSLLILTVCFVAALSSSAADGDPAAKLFAEGVHPRLFFGPEELPTLRSRADREPWKGMLAAVEWALDNDRSNSWIRRPSNYATLHAFRGDAKPPADWSDQALRATLTLMANKNWGNPDVASLTRAAMGITSAVAYDLCYSAWKGKTVPAEVVDLDGETQKLPEAYVGMEATAAVSLALQKNSDSLMESGGKGFPGAGADANNWWGIRFAAAGIGYLANDEPMEQKAGNIKKSADIVERYFRANLGTDPRGKGWNVEGIAYAQFPGWFTHPFILAYERSGLGELRSRIPQLPYALWSTLPGVLPIERYGRLSAPGDKRPGWGRGLRPDFDDDHSSWDGEGTGALTFAFAPEEYLPGVKWIFRRLVGDLGSPSWDAASGNGLYTLLYYPEDLEEKNPAEVWGLTYSDPSYGVYIFRNRFQDENDFVFQTTANLRLPFGGHDGPDALSFRLWGLGVPWAVGAGRGGAFPHRGQTTFFPDDPEEMPRSPRGVAGSVEEVFLRRSGDGMVTLRQETSDTGVRAHQRRMIVDFSGESGAPGFFVIQDKSENGRFWRLNTPGFNTIETRKGGFRIVSPGGEVLNATILHPPSDAVNLRTGTYLRGNGFQYRDLGISQEELAAGRNPYDRTNKWVDFATGDGSAVVAMTVTPAGVAVPEVTGGSGRVQAGSRIIVFDGDAAMVSGWSVPDITVAGAPTKADHLRHIGDQVGATLEGSVGDPEGVQSLVVLLDGKEIHRMEKPDGPWKVTLPPLPPGDHEVEMIATDRLGDVATATRTLNVTRTQPPRSTLTEPKAGASFPPKTPVTIAGRVSDPEGPVASVEIQHWGHTGRDGWTWMPIGEVKPGEDGSWAWTWQPGKDGPRIAPQRVRAVAIDAAGDRTPSEPVGFLVSLPFSDVPGYGDVAAFEFPGGGEPELNGDGRWAVVEEDGDLRLRLREKRGNERSQYLALIRGSETIGKGNWRLNFRYKVEDPAHENTKVYVFFGRASHGPVVLDLQDSATEIDKVIKGNPNARGTRVWSYGPAGTRPHAAGTLGSGHLVPPDPAMVGIPGPGWHDVKVERTDRRLQVWVNDKLIIDGEHPWIASPGKIGIGNERLKGSVIYFDDIQLERLDSEGEDSDWKTPPDTPKL